MDQSASGDAPGTGLAWADVEACTLPTADRPLRVAEFDDLFTTSLRSIDQPSDTYAHLVLTGDIESRTAPAGSSKPRWPAARSSPSPSASPNPAT